MFDSEGDIINRQRRVLDRMVEAGFILKYTFNSANNGFWITWTDNGREKGARLKEIIETYRLTHHPEGAMAFTEMAHGRATELPERCSREEPKDDDLKEWSESTDEMRLVGDSDGLSIMAQTIRYWVR